MHLKGAVQSRTKGSKEDSVQQVVIAPGGYTGWLSHPGPALVLIKYGQLSFYDGEDPTCTLASTRPDVEGAADIFMTTREKLKGNEP